MPATGNTPRVRLWADWLLFLVGIVALCVALDLVAHAAYRGDGSVLYWLLVAYSYPDGAPIATVIGLVILALALIAYWVSLRLLAGFGLTPVRSFAIVTLAALATLTGI